MKSPRTWAIEVLKELESVADVETINKIELIIKQAMRDQRHACTEEAMHCGCTDDQVMMIFNTATPR